MRNKRLISTILLIIMTFSLTGSVFAVENNSTDLSEIKDFDNLRKGLENYQSKFENKEEAIEFWQNYWSHIFPKKDIKHGYPLNFDMFLKKNVLYYGDVNKIPKEVQRYDKDKRPVYLGYTQDGRYVTNIEYNEQPMHTPVKIVTDTSAVKKWTGIVKPYQTDYNDPLKVGEFYLGKDDTITDNDKEAYGRHILTQWAKRVENRTPEFAGGKSFYEYFGNDLDKFLKAVTITIPPTSRTYGQAVAWFTTPAGQTHRTYLIEPTEPFDIMAIRDDEFNKTIVKPDGSIKFHFKYKVTGLEKVDGKFV